MPHLGESGLALLGSPPNVQLLFYSVSFVTLVFTTIRAGSITYQCHIGVGSLAYQSLPWAWLLVDLPCG